jgi:tRNA (adenine22-N1)-methyltransferase
VLGLLEPCGHLLDVGTDHALVPLAAVQRGLAQRATGVDRRPAPLAAALPALEAAGEGRVTLVLGDGLAGIPDADAVVMAGLGAATMLRVLAGCQPACTRQLVLAPLTEPVQLRRWARGHGWWLTREVFVQEGRRRFLVMRFTPGAGPDPSYDEAGWEPEALEVLGPSLLRTGGAAYQAWLASEIGRLGALVGRAGGEHLRLLAWLRRAADQAAGRAGK